MRDNRLYKPHKGCGFNPHFVTKLLINYRFACWHVSLKVHRNIAFGQNHMLPELLCSANLIFSLSFRSHPGILKIPNELFYDGELRPCMHLESSSYESWEGLFRKVIRAYSNIFHPTVSSYFFPGFQDFPVIFHGVAGTNQRDSSSPSLYNMAEVNVLMEYLKLLIKHLHKQCAGSIQPQEIGIIAPYRKQVITSTQITHVDFNTQLNTFSF